MARATLAYPPYSGWKAIGALSGKQGQATAGRVLEASGCQGEDTMMTPVQAHSLSGESGHLQESQQHSVSAWSEMRGYSQEKIMNNFMGAQMGAASCGVQIGSGLASTSVMNFITAGLFGFWHLG